GLLNSVLGYEAGDAVVASVAREVETAVSAAEPTALVGHEGGGKLLLLLPGKDAARARDVAERARARVAAAARESELPVPSVTVSAGVACATGGSSRALLRAAESALAEAKRSGRDRIVLAPE